MRVRPSRSGRRALWALQVEPSLNGKEDQPSNDHSNDGQHQRVELFPAHAVTSSLLRSLDPRARLLRAKRPSSYSLPKLRLRRKVPAGESRAQSHAHARRSVHFHPHFAHSSPPVSAALDAPCGPILPGPTHIGQGLAPRLALALTIGGRNPGPGKRANAHPAWAGGLRWRRGAGEQRVGGREANWWQRRRRTDTFAGTFCALVVFEWVRWIGRLLVGESDFEDRRQSGSTCGGGLLGRSKRGIAREALIFEAGAHE